MIPGASLAASDWFRLASLAIASVALVRLMLAVGIMDLPGGRKAHARPTPKAGGVGIIGACALAPALFPALREGWMLSGLAAAAGLGLVGLADDLRERGAGVKLLAQLLAALLVVGTAPVSWDAMGMALAILWLVGVANMFNFMDGLDGLAGGVGLVAGLIVAAVAPAGGATQIVALALVAGLAGFLPFNLPPARIFLGDTGSQFCGLLLGVLGLRLAVEPAVAHGGWLLPMLLSGMFVDVGATLARRAWAGAPIARAHRDHIYQRMCLRAWQVSAAHAGFAAIGGLAWLAWPRWGLAGAFLLLAAPQMAWLALARRHARPVRI